MAMTEMVEALGQGAVGPSPPVAVRAECVGGLVVEHHDARAIHHAPDPAQAHAAVLCTPHHFTAAPCRRTEQQLVVVTACQQALALKL